MAARADIAEIQAMLAAAFPNYHPADPALVSRVWFEILGDLPADLLKMAVMQYCSESHEFAPSAGTIRDYAFRLQARAAGIPDAYQAYREVCEMPADKVKRWIGEQDGETVIFQQPLEFSHPLVAEVAAMMGWPRGFPTGEPGVDRAQFIRAYESQVARHMADAARLAVVEQYITSGAARSLPAVAKLVKQLEMKK